MNTKNYFLALLLSLALIVPCRAEEVSKVQSTSQVYSHSNVLGVTYAQDTIATAASYLKQNRPDDAIKRLNTSFITWLEDATEYHTDLFSTLKMVDTAKTQADVERELAMKFAIIRDKAYFQLSLAYIEKKELTKATEYLVNIVKSQPRTDLGYAAYSKLQEIGFTYKVKVENAQPIQ